MLQKLLVTKEKAWQRKQEAANKKAEADKKEKDGMQHNGNGNGNGNGSSHLHCSCHLHSSIPNHLHLHEGTATLGSKKMSQTSLDQYGHHRTHQTSGARRTQRSPVYRTSSTGNRLADAAETELLDSDRNPSAYAMVSLQSK